MIILKDRRNSTTAVEAPVNLSSNEYLGCRRPLTRLRSSSFPLIYSPCVTDQHSNVLIPILNSSFKAEIPSSWSVDWLWDWEEYYEELRGWMPLCLIVSRRMLFYIGTIFSALGDCGCVNLQVFCACWVVEEVASAFSSFKHRSGSYTVNVRAWYSEIRRRPLDGISMSFSVTSDNGWWWARRVEKPGPFWRDFDRMATEP